MVGSMITKGSRVEVSSDDEGFKDAWYVATVVDVIHTTPKKKAKKTNKNIGYLVRYDTLFEEEDSSMLLTEAVDAAYVRPLPPRFPPRADDHGEEEGGGGDFELYDVVDAYHREGWWTGVVSKVVVDGDVRRYVVSFQSPPEEFQFQSSDLRLHLDWVDRRSWVPRKKKIPEQATSDKNATQTSKSDNDVHPGFTTQSKEALTSNHSEKPNVGDQLSAKDTNPSSEKAEVNDQTVNAEEGSFKISRNKRCMDSVGENSRAKRFQPSAGKNGNTDDIDSGNASSKSSLHEDSLPEGQEMITKETGEPEDSKSQHKKKRGRPPKLPAKRPNDLLSDTQESEKTNCCEPHQLGDGTKDTETAIDEMPGDLDERPLSMWYQGLHPPTVSKNSRVSRSSALDHHDEPNKTAVAETPALVDNGEIGEKHQDLPFVRSSPIWATLESLELYQTPPQKPHFSPLMKCKEDFREGLAIGRMVTFANVVERTSKLNLADPKEVIESSLETLVDLENHGFHVDAVRARLNEMLSRKAKVGHLEDESKKVESELEKCDLERSVVEQEINQLEVEMRELQEKLAEAIKVKNSKDKEIGMWKSKLNLFSDHIVDAKLDFEKLAATPL